MSLPILQPSSTPNIPQIRGQVSIDPSVIVATGVILNATPGHKIIIHAGVCLGMGCIVTAHGGDVEIQPNAILGAGTLIMGCCRIGSQASLGTSVTVYHAQIEELAVIPAGSIIGDYSRQLSMEQQSVVLDGGDNLRPTSTIQPEVKREQAKSIESAEKSSSPEIIAEPVDTETPEYSQNNIIDRINQLNKNNHLRKKTTAVNSPDNNFQNNQDEYLNKENLETESPPSSPKQQISNYNQNNYSQTTTSSNAETPSSGEELTSSIKDEDKSSAQKQEQEQEQSSSHIVQPKEVVGKVYISRLLYTLFPERKDYSP